MIPPKNLPLEELRRLDKEELKSVEISNKYLESRLRFNKREKRRGER
jgi:hypothetical protein